MKLKEWIKKNVTPGELCFPPMSANDAADILKTELLSDDVVVNYPGNAEQILGEIVCAIVDKYGVRNDH